jgi:hypothetical protein
MGYNLTIGEAVIECSDDWIRIGADHITHPDAPDHCPYTGKGNSRSPSYGAWHDFCKEAGIYQLFYGSGWDRDQRRYIPAEDFYRETIWLDDHPGCAVIVPADLGYIRSARIQRESANGGRSPGFWTEDGADNGTDPVLARLLWLEFWVEWALNNCKNPIIANT